MSSLRISHQNRAIAPPSGGDTGRAEHADDGGFALALGNAAGGVAKDAWVSPGSQSGDSSGSRKRDQTKGNDAAAVAASVAGSLVATAAANGSATTAVEASLSNVDPLTAGVKGSGAGAPGDRSTVLAGTPGTPSSPAVSATTPTTDTTAAAPVSGSVLMPNPALAGLDQTALAAPNGDAAAGSPDIATFGAVADAAGGSALPTLAAPAGPRLDTARSAADLPSGTSPSLPAVDMGQSAMADGGGAFASTTRDHFSPIASTTDAGDAATAAASTPAAGGSSPALSASATAPELTSDPGGAGSMADQIAGHMARMLSNGSHEVTMRLHPPELGDLTMRVAVNGRDVSAWFASPQPQVQAAISEALGQLQTNLGGAGYNLTGAWVGGDASGERQQSWSNSPSPSQVGASLAVAAAAPAAAAPRPASSGLNIYV